jgi:hypothetical protein
MLFRKKKQIYGNQSKNFKYRLRTQIKFSETSESNFKCSYSSPEKQNKFPATSVNNIKYC